MQFNNLMDAINNTPEADIAHHGLTFSPLSDTVLAFDNVALDPVSSHAIRKVAHNSDGQYKLTKKEFNAVAEEVVLKNYPIIPAELLSCQYDRKLHEFVEANGWQLDPHRSRFPESIPAGAGHLQQQMRVVYTKPDNAQRTLSSPIMRGEFSADGQVMSFRVRCAAHCTYQVAIKANWKERLNIMKSFNDHRNMAHHVEEMSVISGHAGWVLKAYEQHGSDAFMKAAGYVPAMYSNCGWDLDPNAWRSRPWLEGNYHHTTSIVVDTGVFVTAQSQQLAAMFAVWRRMIATRMDEGAVAKGASRYEGHSAMGALLTDLGFNVPKIGQHKKLNAED
jgi:hypothetical protein